MSLLKYILKENKDKNLIYKIALEIREKNEKYFDWEDDKSSMEGQCLPISKELVQEYKKYNINARCVIGYYLGASKEYFPNMDMWDHEDFEEYENREEDKFAHHWVLVNNKYIVDITVDQFHPNDEDNYRVIITDKNNSNYKSLK